jgi:hypothetical protein
MRLWRTNYRRSTSSLRQTIGLPALQRTHINARHPTGRLQPRSIAMSVLDPLRTSLAIFQRDYSSSPCCKTPFSRRPALRCASSIAAGVITACSRAAAVHTSARHLSSVAPETPEILRNRLNRSALRWQPPGYRPVFELLRISTPSSPHARRLPSYSGGNYGDGEGPTMFVSSFRPKRICICSRSLARTLSCLLRSLSSTCLPSSIEPKARPFTATYGTI